MSFPEKRKKKFGDRKDGHLVKDVPALNVIMSTLYPNRCDCEVSGRIEADITDLLAFIKRKNEENPEGNLKFFHCFIAALVRTLNERRLLNRFVRGGRIYERDFITASFTAKRKFTDSSKEALLTYRARRGDTLEDISRFILGEVHEIQTNDDKMDEVGKKLETVARLPRVIRMLITRTVRTLDFWGWLPSSLSKGDPSFATALVANLGSIRCPSAYHHLNNYGTTSILITIGTITRKNVLNEDGTVVQRDFVELTATCDERIADGFYFSKSIRLLERFLQNPEILEKPLEEDSGLGSDL